MTQKKRHRYLAEIIYGGMDGTITTFAVIAGATGGLLSGKAILILGFANVFSDGISMAIGDFLSNKAEMAQGKGGHIKAIYGAIVTFCAFVLLGSMPILPYVIHTIWPIFLTTSHVFLASCILTGITFVIIGWTKSTVTQTSHVHAIIQTAGLGSIAAGLAYVVGKVLERVIQ